MTRQLLEQYSDLAGEIQDLESIVGCGKFTSDSLFLGQAAQLEQIKRKEMYKTKLETLRRQKLEIEMFIDSLPSSKQRRLVRLKVVNNLSWNEIAAKMGYTATVEGLRKTYTRAVDSSIELQQILANKVTREDYKCDI